MVTAKQGTFTILYDAGVVTIGRIAGFTYTELGQVAVPGSAQPPDSGEPLVGAIAWTMTCPGTTAGAPPRILFGSIHPAASAAKRNVPADHRRRCPVTQPRDSAG